MSARTRLDVSGLPCIAFGVRDPIFWGVVSLIAIETTMFALLVASYYYVRQALPIWPPEGVNPIPLGIPVAALAALVLSAWPTHRLNRAALEGDLRGIKRWTWALVAAGAAFLALRYLEFRQLDFTWKSHVYGTLFWSLLVMHTLHGVTGTLENAAFGVLVMKGPVEDKLRTDLHATGVYWYAVIAWWVASFAVLYLEGAVLRAW